MNIFNAIILDPIFNALIFLYNILGDLGLAIVVIGLEPGDAPAPRRCRGGIGAILLILAAAGVAATWAYRSWRDAGQLEQARQALGGQVDILFG